MRTSDINKCNDVFTYQYTISKKDLNHAGSWDVSKILIKMNVVNSFIIQTFLTGISYDKLLNARQHVDFVGQAVLGDEIEIESRETNRDSQFFYIKVVVSKNERGKKKPIAEGDFIFMIEKFALGPLSLS